MKKIVAKTLQDALLKASEELRCSVVDLEYEVVQNPSNGLLGIGRKEAIIVVDDKRTQSEPAQIVQNPTHKEDTKTAPQNPIESTQSTPEQATESHQENTLENTLETTWGDTWGERSSTHTSESTQSQDSQHTLDSHKSTPHFTHLARKTIPSQSHAPHSDEMSPKLHKPRVRLGYSKEAFDEIKRDIVELFSYLPFEIDSIKVELYKENVAAVTINGPDCALLIGEKGYRYKAISYLLFNWINPKYGYGVRLEIAEFLRNQEQMIDAYLDGIIKIVRTHGKAQTKVLDGVLAYIALGKLRVIFPHKYISFRLNDEGQRYIVINDFDPS